MFKFYHKVDNEWVEITELELHAKLYVHVRLTTPVIKQMLKGDEVYINGDKFKLEAISK